MTETEPRVIHCNVYDPSGFHLFKPEKNARAECQTITCRNTNCPLLAMGTCHMRGGLFGNRCPYGTANAVSGPTKRAAGCSKWVREHREKYNDVPFLKPPACKLSRIGDFVLLPYSFMPMCEAVPFRSRGSFFSNGDPFLPVESWTVESVVALVRFRPRSMMGGEITSYQKEEVPKFLTHLREVDPEMWNRFVAAHPEYDTEVNHVGRKAVLRTLKSPLEWTEENRRDRGASYPVTWKWDGTNLTSTSMHLYSGTWGRVEVESVVIKAVPKENATVVVQRNEWVNSETVFVD